jgi:hypothetical protein
VDNTHKHFSYFFLLIYLKAVALALKKEFRATFSASENSDYLNVARWRRLYYDYDLSNGSFVSDIENPLRLSEEEKPSETWQDSINKSILKQWIKEYQSS